MCLKFGGSCGQGCYALMSSRERHSLVATRGGETCIASKYVMEVDHTGFADGLNVRGKEERSVKNASWVPGLSNREGGDDSFLREGTGLKSYFSGDSEVTLVTIILQI